MAQDSVILTEVLLCFPHSHQAYAGMVPRTRPRLLYLTSLTNCYSVYTKVLRWDKAVRA